MGTEKRARQKANRQLKLEEQERAEKRSQVRQYGIMAAIVAVALVGGLFLISLATGGDDPEEVEATETIDDAIEEADGDVEDGADDDAEGSADDDAEDAEEEVDPAITAPAVEPVCPEEDGSSPRTLTFTGPPPLCIDDTATYVANFDTNFGTITAELDASQAPNTVNNFVFLARYHYYENTAFHRIISDFVIQGGDPKGTPPGTGGPGYTIEEEVPEAGDYQVGSLAMAKGTDPGTTGAQFFIVTGANGESLPPIYSLFGQVTEGLDIVEQIEAIPTGDRDFPTEEIIVSSVTITES